MQFSFKINKLHGSSFSGIKCAFYLFVAEEERGLKRKREMEEEGEEDDD